MGVIGVKIHRKLTIWCMICQTTCQKKVEAISKSGRWTIAVVYNSKSGIMDPLNFGHLSNINITECLKFLNKVFYRIPIQGY